MRPRQPGTDARQLGVAGALLLAVWLAVACELQPDAQAELQPDAQAELQPDALADRPDRPVDGAVRDACTPRMVYRDLDGDGVGAGAAELHCSGVPIDGDCDDDDPQRRPFSNERFADGVDSNCDEQDDPRIQSRACSCQWLTARGMPEVATDCDDGFEPAEGDAALADTTLGAPTCPSLPDLEFAFVAQCNSECYQGPLYVAIANVGGQTSRPAAARLAGRPELPIEALAPGERTSLIAIEESREVQLSIISADEECDQANNEMRLFVTDYHCGFLP